MVYTADRQHVVTFTFGMWRKGFSHGEGGSGMIAGTDGLGGFGSLVIYIVLS